MAQAEPTDPYRELREQIDRIDAQLLDLLNERAGAALEIGRLKRARNEPVRVPERERVVLERAVQANPGPLGAVAIRAVFEAIMEQMRALEETHGEP